MKPKQSKPLHVIEAERKEIADLIDRIVRLTDRIPKKVLQQADYYGAVRFKDDASRARKLAQSAKPTLSKLRAALNSIEGYYRE